SLELVIELLDIKEMSTPVNLISWKLRMTRNFSHFSKHYFAVFVIAITYSLLSHWKLLSSAIFMTACVRVGGKTDNFLRFFGWQGALSTQPYTLLVTVAGIAIFQTSILATMLSVLTGSSLAIILHSSL
ncbi:hypothetical protein B0I35DRAFT_339672, partial [Stachybotrys elegans]